MVDAFRADSPHYRPAKVAKIVGVDPKTAHRAWAVGWPRRDWAPIAEVLEAEKQKARAILFEQRAEQAAAEANERTQAIHDAAQQTADEASMVRTAQEVTHEGLGAIAVISPQTRALCSLVADQIEADCKRGDDDAYKLSASAGLHLLDRVSKVTKTLLENARQAMEMERLRLGRPLGGTDTEQDGEMTVEEADTRIDAARQAIADAREAGIGLTVVDGGKAEPSIGKRVELV